VDILRREQSASGILTPTLDRLERKNALDLARADELVRALEHAEESATVRVVVLTGAGDTFYSGGDLAGDGFEGHALAFMRRISRPAVALHRRWVPAEEALALGLANEGR